jgi:hypothetical protein
MRSTFSKFRGDLGSFLGVPVGVPVGVLNGVYGTSSKTSIFSIYIKLEKYFFLIL